MSITNLRDQLKRDEGVVLHVYKDSKGIPTAGVGHNLPAHGIDLPVGSPITQEQCDTWLDQDIAQATQDLAAKLPWTSGLDAVRKGALINMAFNMGIGDGNHGLTAFHHFLADMQSGQWEAAATAAAQSAWYTQVGARARRLCEQIRTGVWQ